VPYISKFHLTQTFYTLGGNKATAEVDVLQELPSTHSYTLGDIDIDGIYLSNIPLVGGQHP
jgi:hypothetical protein